MVCNGNSILFSSLGPHLNYVSKISYFMDAILSSQIGESYLGCSSNSDCRVLSPSIWVALSPTPQQKFYLAMLSACFVMRCKRFSYSIRRNLFYKQVGPTEIYNAIQVSLRAAAVKSRYLLG